MPDRRNDNAEHKMSRSRCRPWKHKRCCWRLRFHPARARRNSEHLRWDDRMRTRPAPGFALVGRPQWGSATANVQAFVELLIQFLLLGIEYRLMLLFCLVRLHA